MHQIRGFSRGGFRFDRNRFSPVRKLSVFGHRDEVSAGCLPVVDRCGSAVFGHEACAAKHAVPGERWLKLGRPPAPIQHIRAGYMHEGVRILTMPGMTQDIVQVVGPVEAKGGVGIAGRTISSRVHQVVV